MRIAIVAPLYEPTPPALYGGTERVVYALTEGLIDHGHDVTLFASGDSSTRASLVAGTPRSLRLRLASPQVVGAGLPLHLTLLSQVVAQADSFDLIHAHLEHWALPFARLTQVPVVHTFHGRLDAPGLDLVFAQYPKAPLVSISDSQRAPLAHLALNWRGTVYNGIQLDAFSYSPQLGTYLLYLGRLSPEKGVDWAIEIAKHAGMPLKIAGKVDPREQDYFTIHIKPLLDHPLITFLGEVDEQNKVELLRDAYAMVFPIRWPEPFGLTMIEALACGTPVIATRHGSVPEVMIDGVTGYVCQSFDEMVAAVPRIANLERRACRDYVEARFSHMRMVADYEAVYAALIAPCGR